ncbi:ATP-binding protein [Streptomyces sp. NPDC051098]|uniref:ATP-binding protein n=1 Tax=Streptomyces sp. NPDC051098 TaxID=3155411 RepID=UPI0034303F76
MMDTGAEGSATDAIAHKPAAWAGTAYDGEPGSIAAARHFAAHFLTRLQGQYGIAVARDAVGTVQLVVSELITNACKYAPGPSSLSLEFAGRMLEVTVSDSSPALPLVRGPEPTRVGQHGLEIVMALTEGFQVQRKPFGKRIKVRVPLLPDSP